MFNFDQPWEREVADLTPKGPSTQSAPEGEKNYDNGDYYDDDDDYDDYDDDDDDDYDYNVFSSCQRTSNRDGTRGSR